MLFDLPVGVRLSEGGWAPGDLEAGVREQGFTPLLLTFQHAEQAGALPPHHRDPFDRMLIAQAQTEGLVLVTRDAVSHRAMKA